MKTSLLTGIAALLVVSTPTHAYNMSDEIINSSHLRSKYFEKSFLLDSGMNYQEFIEKADRKRGVVVHSHGCSGVHSDEYALKNFYTDSGFYFALLDFHKRGDARPSCSVSNGSLTYLENPRVRLPPRVQELRHHVKLLREAGFEKIFITGHSEGGMIVQLFPDPVQGAIIHSMFCLPLPPGRNNLQTKYLHLVSLTDPLLPERSDSPRTCVDRPNYVTSVSKVPSHEALADPSWREKIREFLGVKN